MCFKNSTPVVSESRADFLTAQTGRLYFSFNYIRIRHFTKWAQATGLENIGSERTLSGLSAQGPVLSPTRITLENNEKIWPMPGGEKLSLKASGGGNATGVQPSLGRKSLIYNDVAIFGIGGDPELCVRFNVLQRHSYNTTAPSHSG